jgi:thioredoxin 1
MRGRRLVAATRRTEDAMTEPVTVTDESLTLATQANELVIVDFWAEWCAPCRALAPVMARLAEEYAGRVTIAKLDVDANPEAAMRFRVQSIPALVYFRKGIVVDRSVGALPYSVLRAKVEQLLADAARSPTAA